MQETIAIFYGSSTCYTEMAAEKIQLQLQNHHQCQVDVFNINEQGLVPVHDYQHIIMGIPTWDYGELQEDWEEIWDEIDDLDFTGKTVALFGLGDQIGYPEWFLDAMGYLHDKLAALGARMIGYWPNQGYDFQASTALSDDKSHFLGLALDDENEFELSEERIANWCAQILAEFTQP